MVFTMKWYFISLSLHTCFLLITTTAGLDGVGGNHRKGVSVPFEVIDQPEEQQLETFNPIIEEDPEFKIPKKKAINADKRCPNSWYGGIGIQDTGNGISKIFKGYTADLAGIEVGDIIVSTDGEEIVGTPGTGFYITINRKGNIFRQYILRTKVCYNDTIDRT